ncbi:S-adenosyl-L-methionine-dependent methyltransferase [Mycena sanguinolenta]|uniref:S-adenosyl-L-methionine-dependent methyltransferase n=1 Tax=Mycena sanguinolenta TaxID=230812 RepID=A0A8H6ZC13_9AGAR|nr:S-adenosyl-L-methionine-dependent methyltransferase [Mycena sanguinolenta]
MNGEVVSYPGLPAASDSERLDTMHNVIARYFGNELGPAPLNGLRPSKIMELGCGTGAWSDIQMAVQAAKQFPDAQVVAVDQFPLPDRILPPNMNFQLADLKQKLEFEDDTFDIVHSRLVMMHVVDGRDALRRASKLVKPGGLLLIEDLDAISLAESGGPATRRSQYKLKEIQERRGVDVEFGRKIEAIIKSLGDFSDIQVKKVSMPFGANTSDETLNQLGLAMKKFITEFFGTFSSPLHDQGLTRELVHEFREEQEQSDNKSVMDMYFCWARRSPSIHQCH